MSARHVWDSAGIGRDDHDWTDVTSANSVDSWYRIQASSNQRRTPGRYTILLKVIEQPMPPHDDASHIRGSERTGNAPEDEPVSSITDRAAAILQEELAAGTLSTSVDGSSRNDAIANELAVRQDQQRAVDEILDRLDRILDALQPGQSGGNELVEDWSSKSSSNDTDPGDREIRVPVFSASRAVAPGDTAAITLRLACDDTRSGEVRLTCTDFVSGRGRIPASRITITPDSLRIPPTATAGIIVRVNVPATVFPGDYHALLHAASLNDTSAVIRVTVG
jgi:hypothetical protein